MPPEEHLAPGSAVEEDHRGPAPPRLRPRGEKELAVDPQAVGPRNTTSCGSTRSWAGNPAGTDSGARSRGPEGVRIAARAGRRASDRRTKTLPSLEATGDHSIPAPLVTGAGRPPAAATRQTWRRSTSSWFEEKSTSRPPAARETCSTSKAPGVSGVASPPATGTE